MSQFEEIKKRLIETGMSTPCTGTNEDGELVIIEHGEDDAGYYFKLTTSQNNGWLRINTYYEDGTITETYDK